MVFRKQNIQLCMENNKLRRDNLNNPNSVQRNQIEHAIKLLEGVLETLKHVLKHV